jgi:hypothetical protein
MTDHSQGSKAIPLGGSIRFSFKEGGNEVWSIGNHGILVQVYLGNGKDSVLSDVGMAMLEALAGWGKERLDQLGVSELAEKTKSIATNVLVRMHQIQPDAVAALN